MAIKEISGHILEIGDRVKMNIPKIGEGDMDGVEFTLSGELLAVHEHPSGRSLHGRRIRQQRS